MARIFVLGDVHAPYQHKKAVAWAIELAHKFRPDVLIQLGDLEDQFSYSRYPKAISLTPQQELAQARRATVALWDSLPKNCKRYQLLGNHDDRILKKVLNVAPELAPLIGQTLTERYTFKGVVTVTDPELILDGIFFQHGHRSKLGDHCNYNQARTVCGHSHTGGVVFKRNRKGVFWELNAGFLGDVNTPAFGYHAQKKVHTCTLGVGIIDELGPRFVPYPHEA